MSFWPGIISQGITPDAPIFSMSSVTSTSITWKIDNYTSEIEGYSDFTGSGTFGPVQINSGVATVVQSGLSASTSYTISARAFRRLFYSPIGTSSSQFTAPPPPAFTFSSQTANSITWTISSNYDASATYTFIGTGTFSQTGNTVVQSGLSSGTGYTIAGSATKNGLNSGNGPTSDIAYTTLLTPQFELVSRTNNSINWKISDSTYGSSASYSISGTGTITRSGQNITQSGLSAETSYSISGTGTLNNFTTPVGTSNSAFTAPNAPSFTTSSTRNSVTVTITSYSTNYSYRATATAGSVPSSITSSTFNITGLSPLQTIAITLFRTRNSAESPGTTQNATTTEKDTFTIRYVVVGGGGSGNTSALETGWGGGGGAGGLRHGPISVSTSTSYSITIGAGGNQSPGSASYFGLIAGFSGGQGGGSDPTFPNTSSYNGVSGASGGGGWGGSTSWGLGGLAFDDVTSVQGYPGASGAINQGGGGGGAGGNATGITGGPGLSTAPSLIPGTRGGGGSTKGAPGGSGGGGAGGTTSPGANGVTNFGGGGGGAFTGYIAGNGGSGVVILNIPESYPASFSPGLTRSPSTATTGIISITAGTGNVIFN